METRVQIHQTKCGVAHDFVKGAKFEIRVVGKIHPGSQLRTGASALADGSPNGNLWSKPDHWLFTASYGKARPMSDTIFPSKRFEAGDPVQFFDLRRRAHGSVLKVGGTTDVRGRGDRA